MIAAHIRITERVYTGMTTQYATCCHCNSAIRQDTCLSTAERINAPVWSEEFIQRHQHCPPPAPAPARQAVNDDGFNLHRQPPSAAGR